MLFPLQDLEIMKLLKFLKDASSSGLGLMNFFVYTFIVIKSSKSYTTNLRSNITERLARLITDKWL